MGKRFGIQNDNSPFGDWDKVLLTLIGEFNQQRSLM